MDGVNPEWSHNMSHALELGTDTRTRLRGNVLGLVLTDEGCRSLKGVRMCHPSPGLNRLIGYSYQQVATSFPKPNLRRTLRFIVLVLEQFWDGWPTGKFFPDAHEDKVCRKRLVLICEGGLL